MLISLCVAGLTAAAPQLGLPRTVNQNVIVNDVVTTLQPTIANAVANALAALNTAPAFDAERAQFEAEFANRNKAGGSQAAAAGATKAEYNFEYQVRDDKEGTYIYQQEARDGNDVNGVYGFIDPNGDLVTVNYLAGLEGFSQTVDKQENYLGGSRTATSNSGNFGSSSAGNNFGSSSASNNFGSSSASNNFGSSNSLASSSGLDEAALIAQILSVLQPEITASVNRAIAG